MLQYRHIYIKPVDSLGLESVDDAPTIARFSFGITNYTAQ